VIRPGDANEVKEAWIAAMQNQTGPTALLLTRQGLPTLDRSVYSSASGLHQGAYTLWQSGEGSPDILLIATGSEVELALNAAEKLAEEAVNVRVVSMPSCELFEQQDGAYQESVLPDACDLRVAIEAGTSFGWERYVGRKGAMICKDDFGASGPYTVLLEKFGFTVERVVDAAHNLLKG
jgi:transketolase